MMLLEIIAWTVLLLGLIALRIAVFFGALRAPGINAGIEEQPRCSRFVVDEAGRLIDTSEPESPDYHV